MGLFFTGKGDQGHSLVGKSKIDKSSQEIKTVGELDEINSLIGLVKSYQADEFKDILNSVQQNLFIIQANVAEFMFQDETGKPKYPAPIFPEEKVKEIEDLINTYEKEVNPERGFIISGANTSSAQLDYARAVARRAERSVVEFIKVRPLAPQIVAYMNRLSSLLFAMARVVAKRASVTENHPKYK